MKTFLFSYLLIFLLGAPSQAAPFKESDVKSIGASLEDPTLHKLAERTDKTIEAIIMRSKAALLDQGYQLEAAELEYEFEYDYRDFVTKMVSGRHIGDHKPLIEWLITASHAIRDKIGVDAWKMLHISDLDTISYSIPIVFHPCDFPMDNITQDRKTEYRNHLARDIGGPNELYGLAPVITYWAIEAVCLFGTSGVGSLLCGLAASGAERFMGAIVGPALADKIFVRACGQLVH